MRSHNEPSKERELKAVDAEKTKFVISSLARAIVWSVALVVCGYTVAIAISDFKNAQAEAFLRVDSKMLQLQIKVDKLHDDVTTIAKNSWTVSDMERYMNQHRWENRGIQLNVGDPRTAKLP